MAVTKKMILSVIRLWIAGFWSWYVYLHSHWSVGLSLFLIAVGFELQTLAIELNSTIVEEISLSLFALVTKFGGSKVKVDDEKRYYPDSEPPCEMGTDHPFDPLHKNCPGCKK